MHLFYSVNAVVFVEGGGRDYDIDDIANRRFSENSLDILYWSNIFQIFMPSAKLKFCSVGSKSQVLKIMNTVGTTPKVFGAIDRDYDAHLNILPPPNTIWTGGYSIENDFFTPKSVRYAYCSLIEAADSDEVGKLIDSFFKDFSKIMKSIVYLDINLSINSTRFMPKGKGKNKLFISFQDQCHVNRTYIKERIKEIKASKEDKFRFKIKLKDTDPIQDCQGHCLSSYCIQSLRILAQKFSLKINIKSKEIIKIVLQCFLRLLSKNDSETYFFYRNQFELLRVQ